MTSIRDWCSRKIVAWTLSKRLDVSCVVKIITKAKERRKITCLLRIHSDRGSPYVADEYKKATEKMQRSYSKKVYSWDNACIESSHALSKREWLNRFRIHNFHEAYRLVFEYIEAFYNTVRTHSHCNFLSPDEFERLYRACCKHAESLAS